jgi:hypothetical protein
MADTKNPAPKFGAVQEPPPRVRSGELALGEDEAKALVAAINESGWASDGLVYNEPSDAYRASNSYRRALQAHGLMPTGMTLGSRAQGDDGNVILYLRWREPKTRAKRS